VQVVLKCGTLRAWPGLACTEIAARDSLIDTWADLKIVEVCVGHANQDVT